jgi:hypothetical protein
LGAYKLAAMLRPNGFDVVTHLERYGSQRDREPDPNIALECGRRKNILIAADPDFETQYAVEVRQAGIAVFLLSNNHDGADKWGPRIIKARDAILLEIGRRRKPFVAHINVDGEISLVRLYYKKKVKTIHVKKRKQRKLRKAANASSSEV